jgi:ABC-type polysaccharide/polyol phosphate transport system ATPase subunit
LDRIEDAAMSAVPAQFGAVIEAAEVATPAVRTVGLGKRIDDRLILDDINLEIGQGRFVALLGANGAGKTTLLKVLATLTPAGWSYSGRRWQPEMPPKCGER